MASALEDGKPLPHINEVVLKKRKRNEEWALRRREQLEQRRWQNLQDKKNAFKRAEQFILERRKKDLDLIQMKRRKKKQRRERWRPTSELLFVIRLRGKNDIHLKTKKVLRLLRLGRIFSGVFVKASDRIMDMLQQVEPCITYGCPNLSNIRDLIYKKGVAKIDKQRVPLTDNNKIEEALGKYGILCIEDMVNEIANVGPHFEEVTHFLYPFILNKPEKDFHVKKQLFKDGGDAGNREDQINELIKKMN